MASPFDRVLESAGVLDSSGKLTQAEKDKYAKRVESILKNGSVVPGLEVNPSQDPKKDVERLKQSKPWNGTYVDGLLEPTLKCLNTPGNVPLIGSGIHDPSSTFGLKINLPDFADPTNFTPDKLVIKSGLTLPEVTKKLTDLSTSLPSLPPIPELPPIPTPDSVLKGFDIDPDMLGMKSAGVENPDGFDLNLKNLKTKSITEKPIEFLSGLLEIPVKVFKWLIEKIDETLKSFIDGSIFKKVFNEIARLVKIIMEAVGILVSKSAALVATILAWIYSTVSGICASVVSAIIGTGNISQTVYNTPVS
jgi:hypothetical protein